MLRVGLTGGIGSGKSTAARRLIALGALVVDSDVLAREVVQPGTAGLAAVVERFGGQVVDPQGALDRAALGAIVFADPQARRDLEAITHPLVAAAAARRFATSAPGQVVVHDVPLLVEKAMGAAYHLVVVVDATPQRRTDRLVRDRGMTPDQAWARIRAQATDEQRRAAADVLLPNDTTPEEFLDALDRVWVDRIMPFEQNLAAGRPADWQKSALPPDPGSGPRLVARVAGALGPLGGTVGEAGVVDRLGVPVVDLTATVDRQSSPVEVARALVGAGFLRAPGGTAEYRSADPGRPARLTVISAVETRAVR